MPRASLADLKPKPQNDAYTVLLGVSLMAMIAACALLFYDLQRYPTPNPPAGFENVTRTQGGPGGGGGFDPNR